MLTKLAKTSKKSLFHITTLPFSSAKPLSFHYQVLGVRPGFTADELRTAYLQMVKKYHPDLSKQPNAVQKFQEVQTAYDILQDPDKMKKLQQQEKSTEPGFGFRTRQQEDNPFNQQLNQQTMKSFQQKFMNYVKSKQGSQQTMQFSYNLYKKHYESIQTKKKQYEKYYDGTRTFYAPKDQEQQPIWKPLGLAAAVVGLFAGTIYLVNYK